MLAVLLISKKGSNMQTHYSDQGKEAVPTSFLLQVDITSLAWINFPSPLYYIHQLYKSVVSLGSFMNMYKFIVDKLRNLDV